jgi:hypothetical protein
VSFQVTVLKVLAGHLDGRLSVDDLKRSMAILISSGPKWTDRTKRLLARAPSLDISVRRSSSGMPTGGELRRPGETCLPRLKIHPRQQSRKGRTRAASRRISQCIRPRPPCRFTLSAEGNASLAVGGVQAALQPSLTASPRSLPEGNNFLLRGSSVPFSFQDPIARAVLACFDPQWPSLKSAVACFGI